MPINYSLDGTQSVAWHYKARLTSSYQNKIFHNIFTSGVIPESGDLVPADANGVESSSGIQAKIPIGFSFFIKPNNRYAGQTIAGITSADGTTIQANFDALSTLEQSILEKQILKCDFVKDFVIVPSSITAITSTTNKIMTTSAHGFAGGTELFIKSGGAAGFTFGTVYYVIAPEEKTFQLSIYNPNIDPSSPLYRTPVPVEIPEGVSIEVVQIVTGYVVAEYNYLEFSDLSVDIRVIRTSSKPNIDEFGNLKNNMLVLGKIEPSGTFISSIATIDRDMCSLDSSILYEMNVDEVDGYHAGNIEGTIPISNGLMCSGLNTEMVNGYSGYEVGQKWQNNSGLNTEYIADEFARFYQPGNAEGNVPISNKEINVGLNAELLGGSGYSALAPYDHTHSLEQITDGAIFRRPVAVNTSHKVTHDTIKSGSITKEKIANECFFARNDDQGGPPAIVTGQVTVTTNHTFVSFSPANIPTIFSQPPDVMLQILDTTAGYDATDYVKIRAVDISETHFTLDYTGYSGADTAQYAQIANKPLTIQFVAWGYGVPT